MKHSALRKEEGNLVAQRRVSSRSKEEARLSELALAACIPPFKSGIVSGDVLEVLAGNPACHKFDVIIADPPYNIGKDFGTTNDRMPLQDYLKWSSAWIERCMQLLAKGGVLYIYGFPEILAHVATRYPIEEQRWLVWHYTNKTTPSSKFWQRSHESILCLWKPGQARPSLEVNQIREPYTSSYLNCVGKRRAATVSRFGGNRGVETQYKDNGGALPRDVLKIPALAGGAGANERWFMCHDCGGKVFPPEDLKNHRKHRILKHPTQKPFELTRRLLQSRINGKKRGRVLIPFAGSGSECVVAHKLGIEYLGIEINPQYVKFAKKWISHVLLDSKNGTKPRK